MNVFRRIWTGIVAAIMGATLALLVQLVGHMAMGLPLEYFKWILATFSAVSFLLGVLIRPRNARPV